MPLQTTNILYRVLLSALILLSVLWLALADWPWADAGDPVRADADERIGMRSLPQALEHASCRPKLLNQDLIFFCPAV